MLPLICILIFGTIASAAGASYTTSFPVQENPLSESGNWIGGAIPGLAWKDCQVTNVGGTNFVWGNNPSAAYDDPTAILTGTWGSNQTVSAKAKIVETRAGVGVGEIEIRLRSVVTNNWNRGYEVLWNTYAGNAYMDIVAWHGPLSNFTIIANAGTISPALNGDILGASISNATIRVFTNGVQVLTVDDSEWSDGNPGIGFYGDTSPKVGFDWFTASDGTAVLPQGRNKRRFW